MSPTHIQRERVISARDHAQMWLDTHEEGLLAQFMNSRDLRLKFEVWRLIRAYGFGQPPKTEVIQASEDFESLIKRLSEEAQAKAEAERRAQLRESSMTVELVQETGGLPARIVDNN